MKHARNTLAVTIVASLAMLAGCGGGAPTLEDIQDAMRAETEQSTQATKDLGFKINLSEMIQVKDIKDCDETRDNVYTCTVEATIKMFGVSNTSVASMSFTKNSDGEWRAVE